MISNRRHSAYPIQSCCLPRRFAMVLAVCFSRCLAQETQYINDMVLIPLRSGAGSEYRIVNQAYHQVLSYWYSTSVRMANGRKSRRGAALAAGYSRSTCKQILPRACDQRLESGA